MKGKIITIEGLDGTGKSTQIKLLQKKLEEMGIPNRFIHFPMLNEGIYGTLIAEFLRGEYGNLDEVHPKLVALLFAEDRNEHQFKLKQWLAEGQIIILDRYVKSNIAFQCAKMNQKKEKDQLKKWILDFEFGNNALPRPEASFFLDVPFATISKSLAKNREGDDRSYLNGKKDIHEADMQFQKQVLAEYYRLLKETPGFFKIPCIDSRGKWLPATEIHQLLFSKIKPYISR